MIPRTFRPTDTSEHIRFYFLVFLFYTLLVVVSVREIKLTHVGFRAHVKIASRIVSYRHFNKVSPRGRRDDIYLADGSSTVAKIAADLVRPRTGPQSAHLWWSAVAKLQAASVPIA